MKDLSDVFGTLVVRRRDRGDESSRKLIAAVVAAVGGSADWDLESGEDWASIADGSGKLVAYVYAQAPLVLACTAAQLSRDPSIDAKIVDVSDLFEANLHATAESLERLFGKRALGRDLDPSAFSPEDLWFATI